MIERSPEDLSGNVISTLWAIYGKVFCEQKYLEMNSMCISRFFPVDLKYCVTVYVRRKLVFLPACDL